jgi:5'-nucleotidase
MNSDLLRVVLLLVSPLYFAHAFDLTILHLNDHHSHLEQETFGLDVSGLGLDASPKGNQVQVTYGGYPRVTTLFRNLESGSNSTMKLHAGDAMTGTSFFSLFKGLADAEMMHHICFDAMVIGNHEFDDGDAGLAKFIRYLKNDTTCAAKGQYNTHSPQTTTMPVLGANVFPRKGSPLGVGNISNYTIKSFTDSQGRSTRVGIIGIGIVSKTMRSSFPDKGTVLTDEIKAAQENIDVLHSLNVSKIILLTHTGIDHDKNYAASLRGVDIIVGGDSHTLLGDESNTGKVGKSPAGPYPLTNTKDRDGNTVCIVQAWEYSHLVGQLNVSFDLAGRVQSCVGSPKIPYDSTTFTFTHSNGEGAGNLGSDDVAKVNSYLASLGNQFIPSIADPACAKELGIYSAEKRGLEQRKIVPISKMLCMDRFPGQGHGKLCTKDETWQHGGAATQATARAYLFVAKEADISITNGGGTRSDIPVGDFTYDVAFTMLPFGNDLVQLEITGKQIKTVLEEALSERLDNDGSTGVYPYVSGLTFHIDTTAQAGNRVSNIKVNSRLAGTFAPINPDETYIVVTTDFLAAGKDGYVTFSKVTKRENLHVEYAESVAMYARHVGTILPPPVSEYSTQVYIDPDGCDHSVYKTEEACKLRRPVYATDGALALIPSSAQGFWVGSILATILLGIF